MIIRGGRGRPHRDLSSSITWHLFGRRKSLGVMCACITRRLASNHVQVRDKCMYVVKNPYSVLYRNFCVL